MRFFLLSEGARIRIPQQGMRCTNFCVHTYMQKSCSSGQYAQR